ncbi:MAG: nucleotidyltransferase domain-containing protein [Campylobacterota bacterium]|nr:nucleotidyltransferase domain-containing protein [Campylobacterota bacterium]
MLTNTIILQKLQELQATFEKEDVKLLGLFGSYARNEAKEDSDIDILIETTPEFLKKNIGWDAILKLEELKDILKNVFHKEIDFADKQGLIDHNNTYILKKTIYV